MFDNLCRVRDEEVAGIRSWLWIASDIGGWDIPKHDWENSHCYAIKDLVTDWSICVQAGGNQGMYPRLLSEAFEHVYTFEPDPLNFHCLVNNCQSDNIYKIQAALGETTGLARVNRAPMYNTGMHTVATDGECYVPMLTIDSLKLPSCGLLQLDLERYELNALKGAMETITRCKPVIQCESATDEILKLLKPLGYEAVARSKADTFYKVI